MKTRKILTTVASLMVAAMAVAQDAPPPSSSGDWRNSLQFGIKGGFNNSDIYDTKGPTVGYSPLFGPVFGGYLSIPLGTYLGIQPEVLYSVKGYEGTGATSDMVAFSYTDRMNFLDIPVMLQFKPSPNVYLLGGPEYSYLLSRTYTYSEGITSATVQQEYENDNIRHNILGIILGADFNLRHFTLGGRVAWDLQDDNGNGTSTVPIYRNFWGQLTLGYRF